MTTMEEIERKAGELRLARHKLEESVTTAQDALSKVLAKWCDPLREQATMVVVLEQHLVELVGKSPELFKRPQSVEFDGVRVGWRKGKGRLELGDIDKLIERIRAKLTRHQQAAVLKVKTSVLKGPLGKLPAELLKKLGIDTKGAGNEPFVSYPKSDAEKLVDWWLKPAAASDGEEA